MPSLRRNMTEGHMRGLKLEPDGERHKPLLTINISLTQHKRQCDHLLDEAMDDAMCGVSGGSGTAAPSAVKSK